MRNRRTGRNTPRFRRACYGAQTSGGTDLEARGNDCRDGQTFLADAHNQVHAQAKLVERKLVVAVSVCKLPDLSQMLGLTCKQGLGVLKGSASAHAYIRQLCPDQATRRVCTLLTLRLGRRGILMIPYHPPSGGCGVRFSVYGMRAFLRGKTPR